MVEIDASRRGIRMQEERRNEVNEGVKPSLYYQSSWMKNVVEIDVVAVEEQVGNMIDDNKDR